MGMEQFGAKIVLDGSQAQNEILAIARSMGQFNQAVAQGVRNGLQPMAQALDNVARKANLYQQRIGRGKEAQIVPNERISKSAAQGLLTRQQQLKIQTAKLFKQFTDMANAGVAPSSRAMLNLARAFETAEAPTKAVRKAMDQAAQTLRDVEAGTNRAKQGVIEFQRAQRLAAQEAIRDEKSKQSLKDRLMTTNAKNFDQERDQERKRNEAQRKADNQQNAMLANAFATDSKRKAAARGRLGTGVQNLQNRLIGSPFASNFRPLLADASALYHNADATTRQFKDMSAQIADAGRQLTGANRAASLMSAVSKVNAKAAKDKADQDERDAKAKDRQEAKDKRELERENNKAAARQKAAAALAKAEKHQAGIAQHSIGEEKALLRLSSAAQGFMLGQSILQRQVIGVGFSLVFARWAILKYMAAAAAATIVIGSTAGLAGAFARLSIASGKAGVALEEQGQKLANFFQSAAKAQQILAQASKISATLGTPRDETQNMLATLERFGINQEKYRTAILNAAAATDQSITQVTASFVDIIKADADQRGEMTRKFAKDFDLPVKKYRSSVELADALNKRFANSAENSSKTASAGINRIANSWLDFKNVMGSVINEFLKPALEPLLAFINGMTQGFKSARDAGKASGDLNKNVESFSMTMRKLTPYLAYFGYLIGTVMYKTVIRTAQVIKVLADTLIRLWNKMKPVRDFIIALIHALKEFLDKLVGWVQHNKALILTLGAIAFALFGLPRLFALVVNAVSDLIGGILALGRAILGIPKATVEFLTKGFEAAENAIKNLLTQLGLLKDKDVNVNANTDSLDAAKVKGFGDAVDGLHDKKIKVDSSDLDKVGDKLKDATQNVKIDVNGQGAGETLQKSLVRGFINGLAGAIGGALIVALGSISTPALLVAAAVAGALVIGALIGAFPYQTGQIVGGLGTVLINALPLAVSYAAQGIAKAIVLLFQIMEKSIELEGLLIISAFLIPFNVVKDTVTSVIGDIKDIAVGLWGGDWSGALAAGKRLLEDIFINPFKNIGIEIGKVFSKLTDIVLPGGIGSIRDLLNGPDGIPSLSIGIPDKLQDWGETFASGVEDKFTNRILPVLQTGFGNAWDTIVDGFGKSDTAGLRGALKWGFDILKLIGDGIGNPFERFGNFIRRIWEYVSRFLDWIQGNMSALNPANWIGGAIHRFGNVEWPSFDLGGVVPGRPGQRVPVMATAGEVFLGAPNVAASRGTFSGGGGGVTINIDISDTVISNSESMTEFADKVSGIIVQRLGFSKSLTYHRV